MKQQLADLLGIDIRDEWLSSLSENDCRWYYGLTILGMIEEVPIKTIWKAPNGMMIFGNPDRNDARKRLVFAG